MHSDCLSTAGFAGGSIAKLRPGDRVAPPLRTQKRPRQRGDLHHGRIPKRSKLTFALV